MAKINQVNSSGHECGYYIAYFTTGEKWFTSHCINGKMHGCSEYFWTTNGEYMHRFNYKNDIPCGYQFTNSSRDAHQFFNKQSKAFGEQLEWEKLDK